jgi:hypothetical protein
MDEPNPSADDPDQRAQPVRVRSVDAWGTTPLKTKPNSHSHRGQIAVE